jgi:hypothetical protein
MTAYSDCRSSSEFNPARHPLFRSWATSLCEPPASVGRTAGAKWLKIKNLSHFCHKVRMGCHNRADCAPKQPAYGSNPNIQVQEICMKINRIVCVLTLALLGSFAVITPANLLAQSSTDAALNAFQVTVPININNFNFTAVTIPTGYRLVIQDISLSGAAQTNGSDVQPIIIFSSTLGSDASNLRYFAPSPSATVPGQYYADYATTLYADTLSVSPAFAGFTPTFMSFNVVITGYLVDLTPSQGCPAPAPTKSLPKALPEALPK